MYRLLVTGGAGFIGSNFARHILQTYPDYHVHVLDSLTYAGNRDNFADIAAGRRFAFTHGDICNQEIVQSLAAHVDVIVNFAAESHVDRSIVDPGSFIQTDVAGVYTLLEAARRHKHARFLHVSTDEVYGSIAHGSFTENAPLLPNSPYSASKAGGEMQVRAFHVTYGVPTLVTRGSNTFGPYQYPEKLIPLFATNLIDNIPVPVYGDGQQVRDWLYVIDHCRGIDTVLHHGIPGEVYNVGGGNERANLQIVQTLLTALNKPETLIRYVEDRPGHDTRYSVGNSKLFQLGYKPSIDFDERLRETIAWYVNNQEWWRKIKEKQLEYRAFMDTWYKNRQ